MIVDNEEIANDIEITKGIAINMKLQECNNNYEEAIDSIRKLQENYNAESVINNALQALLKDLNNDKEKEIMPLEDQMKKVETMIVRTLVPLTDKNGTNLRELIWLQRDFADQSVQSPIHCCNLFLRERTTKVQLRHIKHMVHSE